MKQDYSTLSSHELYHILFPGCNNEQKHATLVQTYLLLLFSVGLPARFNKWVFRYV